ILKGLAWCCADIHGPDISQALADLAETCFKKVRWLGPRCPKAGNACLYSLSTAATEDAAAQLSRLDQIIKQPTAKKLIGKSLTQAATRTGRTREELEEAVVPTYGLDAQGILRTSFGEFTAEFRLHDGSDTEVVWIKGAGKSQKSVPAEVKKAHAPAFKQFQHSLKDIEKMLAAQRIRLERLFLAEREWDLATWQQRYLNHPLVAPLTRRLIWHFRLGQRTALACWHAGKLVEVNDAPLDWLAPETKVRLWHPIGCEPATVLAWRQWLESHEIVQPFKQAHREIYLLTEAELKTGTYSNRFAAHIIRQHQFVALAKQRGWQCALMGSFDFQSTPTLTLPHWNLAVEFWVNPAEGGREATSEMGIWLYLATDQVRFCHPDGTARPLTEVPALVFSEVMRDIDLFVSVGSIGNDPNWRDTGANREWDGYWQSYSFGDLSVSAQTRHEVLERLLPKLKIASRCQLTDKFLRVQGALRAYKIHLGSGNILMEPNDQYLCIVPDRSAQPHERVFLPFEGDTTLSVILSKAFLLTEDAQIQDPTILQQICPRI
ncbi:MAG TPA: DUF4132 domain-containing protein, partial [Bacillota bacterium]|nr:DUF4132 domain-containing protein [Bacillota bacterium]